MPQSSPQDRKDDPGPDLTPPPGQQAQGSPLPYRLVGYHGDTTAESSVADDGTPTAPQIPPWRKKWLRLEAQADPLLLEPPPSLPHPFDQGRPDAQEPNLIPPAK
jgi:hypothetical protein